MRRAALILITLLTLKAHADDRVERELARMSDADRIAQLMLVGFTGTEPNAELRRMVGERHVGAVALYARNVASTEKLLELTAGIRAFAKGRVEPFIAVDQEGGTATRILDDVPLLPGAMALAATGDAALARRAGAALGSDLRRLGVDMNLAPVVDVAKDSGASAIGVRSFGADPGELASAFIRGQRAAGIVSVVKHFPGLGETAADSHQTLPSIRVTETELAPFRMAIAAGAEAVMLGHALARNIDAQLPATVSPKVIDGLLRKDLQFDGIVLTDVLQMKGLHKSSIGAAAVDAIRAGADMVMVLDRGLDREEVFAALQDAVRKGTLSKKRIETSVRRILRVKLAARPALAPPDRTVADIIALRSVTLLRDRRHNVPLPKNARVIYVGVAGAIPDALQPVASIELPVRMEDGDRKQILARIAKLPHEDVDVVLASARNESQMDVLRALRASFPDIPFVFVSLGSPALIAQLPDVDAYLCAYGYLPPSMEAVAQILTGRSTPVGKLPLDIAPFFRRGMGNSVPF